MTTRARHTGVPALLVVLTILVGCGTYLDPSSYMTARRIDQSISAHYSAAAQIELGDSKDRVFSLLEPTQSELNARERKPPDRYQEGDSVVEIYYFRSGRQPDGLTTDDEFTPYVFVDGLLIATGLAALGGPSSRARSTPGTSARSSRSSAEESATREGNRTVYDADECIGPIINGMCHGTILPKKSDHPTCHGEWVGGRCTGPQF